MLVDGNAAAVFAVFFLFTVNTIAKSEIET